MDGVNSSKQIKIGALLSYISIAFNIVAGLIYTPWMIAIIGQADYGLYILTTSFLAYFVIDFGLGNAVTRFLSKYNAENDKDSINNLLGLIFKLYLIIDIAIIIILIIVFSFIDKIFIGLTIVEIEKVRILFCIAGIYCVFAFPFQPLDGILTSYELFLPLKLSTLLNKALTISFIVIALSMGLGLYSLVVVNVFVGIIIITFKLIYINKKMHLSINFKYKDMGLTKSVFGFSIWMMVSIICYEMFVAIQPTLLGILANSVEIAIFAIGMTIFGYTSSFASAINGLFLPKVSRMVAVDESIEKKEDLMIKVGRIQLFVVGLIIVGFLSMGRQFIELWVGNQFSDSYYVAALLITPSIIISTQAIPLTIILAENKIKIEAYGLIISSIISLLVSIILVKKIGAIGAAAGASAGLIFSYVVWMNVVYKKVLGINIYRFFKECHLKMLLPLILTAILGLLVQKVSPSANLLIYLFKACGIGLIYIVLMWLLSLNNFEKNLFLGIARKVTSAVSMRIK